VLSVGASIDELRDGRPSTIKQEATVRIDRGTAWNTSSTFGLGDGGVSSGECSTGTVILGQARRRGDGEVDRQPVSVPSQSSDGDLSTTAATRSSSSSVADRVD